MKEMMERQADMTRINEKLMKVFENKKSLSQLPAAAPSSLPKSSASCKSVKSELMSKIDQVLSIEKERLN